MSAPSDRPPGPAPAEPDGEPLTLRDRLIGLGEHSHRKSYYPELQLRLAELERFRVLLDQSQDGILLFTAPEGALLDLNGSARRLFALPSSGTPRLSLFDLVPAAAHDALRERLAGGDGEPLAVRLGGRHLELVVRPARFRDVQFALLTVHDLTERRRMEEALRRKDEELGQAQRLEAIGRLAGGIAHDFNNLLTVILGFGSAILQDLRDDDPLREEMGEVLGAARRASDLTRQLLAFGRKQILQPRAVELNAVVQGTERMMRRIIGEQIRVETDLAPDAGFVFADPGQMEQVLVNLVVNARDAMPEGGLLRLSTRRVAAPTGAAEDWIEVAIQDTGVGMDAATRARIFEPFFTTKALGRGTGLGLSTVYGIVRQSGGEVQVESTPGLGTTFRVLLPRAPAPPAAEVPSPAAPAREAGGRETLLVVEDDAAVLRLMCDALAAAGYALLPAADAEEALRRSRAHAGPIHLLLTDVVMPRMSGPDLADALVRERPELRVAFLSGYSDDSAALQRRLGQGSLFLPKPFGPAELLAAVRQVLAAGARAP